jgi:hypothetical protein
MIQHQDPPERDLNLAGQIVDKAIEHLAGKNISEIAIASALLGGAIGLLTRALPDDVVVQILHPGRQGPCGRGVRKRFFFAKKNQKTLLNWAGGTQPPQPKSQINKVFLLLLFTKSRLTCLFPFTCP